MATVNDVLVQRLQARIGEAVVQLETAELLFVETAGLALRAGVDLEPLLGPERVAALREQFDIPAPNLAERRSPAKKQAAKKPAAKKGS